MDTIKFLTREGINDNIHLMLRDIGWDQIDKAFVYTVYLPSYEIKYMLSGRRRVIPLPEPLAKFFNEMENYATIITIIDDDTFQDLFDFTAIKGTEDLGIFRILNKRRINKADISSKEDLNEVDNYCKQLFDKFPKFNTITVLDVEKVNDMPCPIGVIIKRPIDDNKIETITAVLPELDFDAFVEQFTKLAGEL